MTPEEEARLVLSDCGFSSTEIDEILDVLGDAGLAIVSLAKEGKE